MKLSKQSQAVIMTLLQKGILEQMDIVGMFEELDFEEEGGELFVTNPPTSFKVDKEQE